MPQSRRRGRCVRRSGLLEHGERRQCVSDDCELGSRGTGVMVRDVLIFMMGSSAVYVSPLYAACIPLVYSVYPPCIQRVSPLYLPMGKHPRTPSTRTTQRGRNPGKRPGGAWGLSRGVDSTRARARRTQTDSAASDGVEKCTRRCSMPCARLPRPNRARTSALDGPKSELPGELSRGSIGQ